ncbi:MAG: hypothetical protein AAF266_08500 [Planctomycetota bacterium]
MPKSRVAITCALAALLVTLPGCATVVNGRTADVNLKTSPPNALVTIRDAEGVVVAQTVTPGQVELKRNGSWLRPAKYTATIEREGCYPIETELKSKLNPWLLGNVVLGGPIGLGVDAATGAMWRPKHADIELPLAPLDPSYGAVQVASGTQPIPTQVR